jgi:hypothetical protein
VPNPPLAASYSGFVNGETPASLTTPVILTTPASSISPVGSYPIVAGGASSPNYAIAYRNGALSIAQASSLTTMITPGGTSVFGQAVSFTAVVSPAPNTPTGVVNFFIDGSPAGSAAVDPSTGLATFTTTALTVAGHSISAAYSGNTNFLPSQSGAIFQGVLQATTQTSVTGHAVRNRRGQIVAVELDASALVFSPGSGIPAGPVSFFVGSRKLGTVGLSGGTAVLTVNAQVVLGKTVTAQYAGNADYLSSISPKVKITKGSITQVARPFFQFARAARPAHLRRGR